ncbi:hypothetical protein Rhopal_001479-T1 [Rhodotorula paludigena]|uniref:Phosphoglycerate mutase n=1 Tax=Rhodotorula paludigena TaxID=86838 RepID=A0AAV5GEG2_9BASI|nr:hypothetical protein Rhopal_001479-T1 [Rhodotorula paludigena]
MASKTVVTIIDYNKAGIVQGHLDVPLNGQGLAQAAVTGRWIASQGLRFDEAYSSDLSRARVTAETILNAQPQAPQLQLDERIRERGKRRGDPGADPTTVEPIPQLRGRLWSFWDSLFPPAGPAASSSASIASSASTSPSTAAGNRQFLYVSHGAAIREFILSLASQDVLHVEKGGGRSFDLLLPEQEAAAIRAGSKRIDNCSRTVIEMEWLEDESEKGSGRWHGRLMLYADDSHFVDSSRAPSPTANADVVE